MNRSTLAKKLSYLAYGVRVSAPRTYGGGSMIYGSTSPYGIQPGPWRMTREYVGYINEASGFGLGVSLIIVGALSILVTLRLVLSAIDEQPDSRQQRER
jgi:hypothetical protein